MPALISTVERLSLIIKIGEMPVRVKTTSGVFLSMLKDRYAGFVTPADDPEVEFDVEITEPALGDPDADVNVSYDAGRWLLQRGDFHAEWEPQHQRGWIRQTANPYSIDGVLRIIHSLVLAKQGGFLLHSASAVRNGKAFLFAGVSGAGKTTISRLAPHDVTLLTDEISYVRRARAEEGYVAFGTPFTGELAKLGENVVAPIAGLYLLAKGLNNGIDPIEPAEAARSILANLLFFAKDETLVRAVFHSVFEFVDRVPVFRLTFAPDERVWELIG